MSPEESAAILSWYQSGARILIDHAADGPENRSFVHSASAGVLCARHFHRPAVPAQLKKGVESTTLVEDTYVLSPFLCLELSGQLQRGIEQNLVI